MNSKQAAQTLLSGLCLLTACNGTETGNPPVIDFGNSGCHDQSYGQSLPKSSDQGVISQSLDKPMLTP
ncbi:MAG: hypothetical protein JWN04_5050, partial [Myxococcaceae bacterium]|nr:hypothetical protein [Myxococcaceae bacterium]